MSKSVLQEKMMIGACLNIYVTDYTDYGIVFPKMWKIMLNNKMFEIQNSIWILFIYPCDT